MTHPLLEPVLLIVIGLCGAVVCWILGQTTLALICLVIAIGGGYELRETVLHEQDLKRFERE